MGNWYANIALRGVRQSDAIDALREWKRTAFVSRPERGSIVVYDSECREMDGDDSERLASDLTLRLGSTALIALNADDDVLWLCGYERGERIVEYDSSTPHRSGAHQIARLLQRPAVTPFLWTVFQGPFLLRCGGT